MGIHDGAYAGQFSISPEGFKLSTESRNNARGGRQCFDMPQRPTKWEWSEFLPPLGLCCSLGFVGLLARFSPSFLCGASIILLLISVFSKLGEKSNGT